jgi:riboflavin kinase/FMN adenylyltransferase
MPASRLAPHAPFTVVREAAALPSALAGAVVAIGNFDGVHRGHAAVIGEARALAAAMGRPAAAMTFEPHPRDFFGRGEPTFRLTPEPVKLALLRRLGLDGALVLPFDAQLAGTGADAFVDTLLASTLGVSGIVVGYDFHFGRGRAGSPAFMSGRASALGLAFASVDARQDHGVPISSSLIRESLAQGDVEAAASMLGYRWTVRGEIVHGDRRGRTLGYPTANIPLDPACRLRHGIYAVRMALGGVVRDGVASFGRRPTFDDGAPRLEVFLFDFSGDIYGEVVDVEFCAFLRGEEKFDSIDALIAQMDRDSAAAKAALARPVDVPAPSVLPLGELGSGQ